MSNSSSSSSSIPVIALFDKVKRLEEELYRQGKLVEMQQSQIQTLNALVTNIIQSSNHNQSFSSSTTEPTASRKRSASQIELENPPVQSGASTITTSSKASSSLKARSVATFSNKRQRALSVTKAFVDSLPPFGLKSIALPGSGNSPENADDANSKKRGRTKKFIPTIDPSAFRSLSSLSASPHNVDDQNGASSSVRPGADRLALSNGFREPTTQRDQVQHLETRNDSSSSSSASDSRSSSDKKAGTVRVDFDVSHSKTFMRYEDRLALCDAMLKHVHVRQDELTNYPDI
jgi:hypothetical protein